MGDHRGNSLSAPTPSQRGWEPDGAYPSRQEWERLWSDCDGQPL